MPLVNIPYLLGTGDTLVPADFNKNVFDVTTAGVGVNGIMSTPNGGLEYDSTGTTKNLHNDFILYPEHVQPYAGILGGMTSNLKPIDLSSEVFSDDTEASYLRVPGPAIRIDIPRDADQVLFFLSYFVHFFVPSEDAGLGGIIKPDIIIRPVWNGTSLTHLSRQIPGTMGFASGGGGISTRSIEPRGSRHFNLPYLRSDVSAGDHEFGLEIYIERLDISDNFTRQYGVGDGAGKGRTKTFAFGVESRVTFGCRSAGYLML